MPELPEVEVVRRGLAAHTTGRRIVDAAVLHPRVLRRHPDDADAVPSRLVGQRIDAVCRRGKFLWLQLSGGEALVVHLGMSGQMLIKSASTERVHPHLRAWCVLGDGSQVWFVDQRTFGLCRMDHLQADPLAGLVPASMRHIAPDVLEMASAGGPSDQVVGSCRAARRAIKAVLLDQTVVSGIGNIYADEMLWDCGVSPRRKASSISAHRLRRLFTAGERVMQRALAQGGTSFDSLYVNVNGSSGYFSRSLNVYGRSEKPCVRCGTPIRKIVVAGRGTHYCPSCQR